MIRFMLFLALAFSATPAFPQVTVKFEDEKFAMRLVAKKGEEKPVTLMRPGKISLTGELSVSVESGPTNYYYVVSSFLINDGQWSELHIGTTMIVVKDGDTIVVRQIGIIPPNNAALVPFKGGTILVSLMYPPAVENPDDFKGPEEFRSSALFVAKYGSASVAKTLAEQALKDKGSIFRGDQQISVIRQSNTDGTVVKAQEDTTVEDLADAIQIGLLQLQLQGWSQEVLKAKKLLEEAKE